MAGTPPTPLQTSNFILDDRDLDDAELWAVIDSAAASNSEKSRKPLPLVRNSFAKSQIPTPFSYKRAEEFRGYVDGEVMEENAHQRPSKIARFEEKGNCSPSDGKRLVVIKKNPLLHHQMSPNVTFPVGSPETRVEVEAGRSFPHSLAGQFPSVALFKQYQNAAIAILEKSDYAVISGNPFIKKSGWRKISFYFNLSFEIKDKSIEFDDNRNVVRAEFVARAHMQGGRYSDGWGSCERHEKRFQKPNHDIPSTAETRAKNKACQDLLGVGQYRSGSNNSHV